MGFGVEVSAVGRQTGDRWLPNYVVDQSNTRPHPAHRAALALMQQTQCGVDRSPQGDWRRGCFAEVPRAEHELQAPRVVASTRRSTADQVESCRCRETQRRGAASDSKLPIYTSDSTRHSARDWFLTHLRHDLRNVQQVGIEVRAQLRSNWRNWPAVISPSP